MRTVIRNISDLYTMDAAGSHLKNVDLLIEGKKITAIGKDIPVQPGDKVIDGSGKVCLPGFVNVHHHFFQNITRNIPIMQKGGLLRWLLFSYGAWSDMSEEDVYASARLSAAELLLTGVSTSMDFFYFFPQGRAYLMDTEFKAVREMGLRFHGYRGCMPEMEGDIAAKIQRVINVSAEELIEDRDTILTACEDTFNKFHDMSEGAMTRVGIGPTTVPFDNPGILTDLQKMAEAKDGLLHTHFHPLPDEREYCKEHYNCTPHQFLESIGFLSPRLSVAHIPQHTAEDIAMLAKNGVSATHSPSCHMRLGYPVAPIPECVKAGVNVGIGVDGGSSNDSGDMLAELRSTLYVHRIQGAHEDFGPEDWFGPMDVFRMATTGGAKLLQRDDIGSLEVGKMADVILMDMNQIAYGSAMTDPLGALVYCGCNHRVHTNIVNGDIVVEDGKLLTAREEDIVADANRITEKVLRYVKDKTGIDYSKAPTEEVLARFL